MRGRIVRVALSALCSGLFASPVLAATATSSIPVSATVQATCVVSASSSAFGTYTGSALTATTTISITCTNAAPYNVGLDAGTGTGASVTTRLMSLSSSTLAYSLYTNSGHSTVWGNTISSNTVTGTGTGSAQTLTVYGQISANQYPTAGSYTDTVTVTVTY